MAYSLFVPLPGLPWYLWPVWPLIFWRIQRLQAWFRREAPPGAQMLWGIAGWGDVVVLALSDDFTGRRRAPLPGAEPSPALRAALDGEDVHRRHVPLVGLSTAPRRLDFGPCSAAHDHFADRLGVPLPLPDT